MDIFAIALAAALHCQPRLVILSHEYSDAEVRRWPQSGWVGWGTGEEARAVKLRVSERVPGCEEDQQDVRLQTSPVEMSFAARCVIQPGKIVSIALESGSLEPDRPLKLTLGATRYQIVARSDGNVILSAGKKKQLIYSAGEFVDDPHFTVIWAGDLDRDGKLDLVVNLSRKYSVHPFRLLLSSKAVNGRLVRDVASVTLTAC